MLATIALTVVLVVGVGDGARGLLLGSYLTGAAFVLGADRDAVAAPRPAASTAPLMKRLLRFGLPTMPAEASLYLLNFVDRHHHRPLRRAWPRPASTRWR